jgi:type VI secretion system protein ImpA
MPLLDFAELTAPIPGEQPAGIRLPPDVRKKLEDARKEFEPHPDDPSQPPIPKKPDWSGIVRLASESLTQNSKDLLAVVRLVEAMAHRDQFAGLRDGLHLMRLMLTDCWDRIHPLVEEPGDIEYRAGPVQWLTDTEGGAWFPAALSKLPFLKIGDQDACLTDCKDGKLNDQPLSTDTIRAGAPLTPTIGEEIGECLTELDALDQILTEKMADQAPSMGGIRDVLAGCKRFIDHLHSSSEAPAGEEGAVETSAGGEQVAVRTGGGTSRADVYRLLARLADDLARMEPHSPIPDLLRWAVKLGNMPFRELIQELVREPGVLADIRRQLGIPETEGSQ